MDGIETLPPALSASEWQERAIRRERGGTYHMDLAALTPDGEIRVASEADGELIIVPSHARHALAALALYGQAFGFVRQDVEDEREVAEYCDTMAAQLVAVGDEATALTFRSLAERHRRRASKIAALLPPD